MIEIVETLHTCIFYPLWEEQSVGAISKLNDYITQNPEKPRNVIEDISVFVIKILKLKQMPYILDQPVEKQSVNCNFKT